MFGDITIIPRDPATAAIHYHRRGLRIIPFKAFRDANNKLRKVPWKGIRWKDPEFSLSEDQIGSMVDTSGIFGMKVPKTICILDLDAFPTGFDNLAALAAQQKEITDTFSFTKTLSVITPSSGMHLYFTVPNNRALTTAGKIAPNVDTRSGGNNSCIILPPSVVPGIDYPYAFDNLCEERRLPSWIYRALTAEDVKPSWTKKVVKGGSSTWAESCLNNSITELEEAVEGTRNATLNRIAFTCYKFLVQPGLIAEDRVSQSLVDAGLRIGLSRSEIANTLRSAQQGASVH